MKIVTVAAGLGSRLRDSVAGAQNLSSNSELPKPLYPLLDHPIAYWSIKSFEHWITTGMVSPKDLIFVVQKAHVENFSIDSKLREYIHPQIQIIQIDGLTKGPAETALMGMAEISELEPVLINDCDHHFQAASLQRLIQRLSQDSTSNQVALACTNTRSTIPSWSYLELEETQFLDACSVLEIREKDFELMSRGAKGVIGAYYFSSKKFFTELYKETFKNTSGEYYISRIVQEAIAQKTKVWAAESEFGYPLGNILEIEFFENQFQQRKVKSQSGTFFFDIDGVIIEHDSGYHSRTGKYDYESREIPENVALIRQQYAFGSHVCLTTARPERERGQLEKFLQKSRIPFDQLIMSLNPGKRILVNDRKSKYPSEDSAIAISSIRNQKILSGNYNYHSKYPIIDYLTGGSGVETLRLSSLHLGTFVRKCIPNLPEFQRHAGILKLQAEWYEKTRNFIPEMVPKVYFSGLDAEFSVLDLEDLGHLENLSKTIDKSQSSIASQAIDDLLKTLGNIYTPFLERHEEKITTAITNRNFLIYEKAIPGIDILRSRLSSELLTACQTDVVTINGKNMPNPLLRLKSIAIHNSELLGYYSNFKTLIHGDLTFENVLIRNGKPLLIDPLGAFMDPKMQSNPDNYLDRVSPMWDLIKLLQSSVLEYEKWNNKSGILKFELSTGFEIDSRHDEKFQDVQTKRIIEKFSEFGMDLSHSNLKLMLAILVFRLIPYKLGISVEKAMYCWALGTLLLEDI